MENISIMRVGIWLQFQINRDFPILVHCKTCSENVWNFQYTLFGTQSDWALSSGKFSLPILSSHRRIVDSVNLPYMVCIEIRFLQSPVCSYRRNFPQCSNNRHSNHMGCQDTHLYQRTCHLWARNLFWGFQQETKNENFPERLFHIENPSFYTA